jgi:hypothetical protein
MEMETIIAIVLTLPLGVWLGYRWRDSISQQRRALYLLQRSVRETVERNRRKRRLFKASSGNIIDLISRIPTRRNPR